MGSAQALESEASFDFAKSRGQLLIVEGVRVAFLVALLLVTVAFQAAQPQYVNVDVLLPVFLLLGGQFLLNSSYIVWFDVLARRWQATAFLFSAETAFIAALIYFTGVNQSIFLFLFLVNIILAGFVFQRRGALLVAAQTSISFSLLMIFGPDAKGQTFFFAIVLNNLAFFAVAALSGFLSEQLNFMGSELKARARSLAALQNLNELIVGNMATGLITFDEHGTSLLVNPAAAQILDLTGPVVGRPLEQIIPGLRARIATSALHVSERGEERFDWVYVAPGSASGQGRMTLEATASRLRDAQGQATGYVLTFQDSTKVRRLEFAVRQSEKLAAVGQLAAGIAHEIRNPLASISGSIQLLESSFHVGKDAEERKLMRIVLKEIDRLNDLISEFLVYVRPDQAKEDPVDLSALVREILEMTKLNLGLRRDVRQSVDLGPGAVISGDRDKLKQAILNVVINAYQAMTEAEAPILDVSAHRLGAVVRLKIRDRGVGIEDSRLRKIFEPFHTTKPKGTGLGLALTHKIIENHGGKIFVEGAGPGTEFTFEFPARRFQAGPDAQNGLAVGASTTDDFNQKRKRGSG